MKMPSKEQILEASKDCPDAKEVLTKLFPEAFKEPEEEWVDITLHIEWKPSGAGRYYWLRGFYGSVQVACWYATDGIKTYDMTDFRLEMKSYDFRILKRQGT